jgi:hypothetical protein
MRLLSLNRGWIPLRRPQGVRDILVHLGEPITPPTVAPARGPPLWEMPPTGQREIDPRPSRRRLAPAAVMHIRRHVGGGEPPAQRGKTLYGDAQLLHLPVGPTASTRDTLPQQAPRGVGLPNRLCRPDLDDSRVG